ncbi:sigma-70 family RNA polymerase sigma factor [Paenibacillus harenae]|uniref:sigma-70 family RNA polymerase sigma factor n=1 Tax=Paenibacillus harenae TaxID=306543 RepID=UPI00040B6700|nr:sigma-70 family RNA polymerase sigma factor [Paenibacillus harenae]
MAYQQHKKHKTHKKQHKDRFTDIRDFLIGVGPPVPNNRILEFRDAVQLLVFDNLKGRYPKAVTDDMVQDAMARIVGAAKKGKIKKDLLGYSYYKVLDAIKAYFKTHVRAKEQLSAEEYQFNPVADFATSASISAERRENIMSVRAAINKLSERERVVIYRHYYLEETLEAIGQDLGYKKGSVRSVHKRALERLQKILESEWKLSGDTYRDHTIAAPTKSERVTTPWLSLNNKDSISTTTWMSENYADSTLISIEQGI